MVRAALVAGMIAVLAAGCDTASTAPPGPQPPAGSGTKVTAKLTDFHIELSQQSFPAGVYTFVVNNAGQATHSLEIQKEGVADYRSDNIRPGHSDELTVQLEAGTYQVWCPVGNHRSQGMNMELTVTK
ncbi:cupredoxin domain-containing protein [Actinocrispum sp. NPDC049592]|uniref:cupredoxin domain-containing protein n=1 Tax=Actinocrispum sp. NPDC049592 TaxID=3154835 RepID=UPI00341696CB